MGRRFTRAFDAHNMVPGPAANAIVQVMYKSEDGILDCYGSDAVSVLNAQTAGTYAPGCKYTRVNGASSIEYINEAAAGAVSSFIEKITADGVTALVVAEIEASYQSGTAAGEGPSPLIWDNSELLSIMLDKTQGILYDEDFMGPFDPVTAQGYTLTQVTSGGLAVLTNTDGGVMLVSSEANAGADDGINAQLANCMFLAAAGRTIRFEARVKFNDCDTAISQFFIGLAGVDTTLIAAGVMDDTVDKAGFYRAGASTTDKISSITARTSEDDATADVGDLVDDTFVKLGFVIDGLTSIKFYVNGVLVETGVTTNAIPNAVMCLSYVAQTEGATKDAEMSVDWVRILQTGTRS